MKSKTKIAKKIFYQFSISITYLLSWFVWMTKCNIIRFTALIQSINNLRANFLYEGLSYFCQRQNVTREKLQKALLYKKCTRKTLIKLTPALIQCINLFNGNKELIWFKLVTYNQKTRLELWIKFKWINSVFKLKIKCCLFWLSERR